ncbi:MAG TPA: VOC family protein [Acidimicrobiales bacterium]|nr:VOC family protein [Acidimicrobiales bacterium]
MPTIAAIHHVSVTVTETERSVAWYGELLGLEKMMEEKHPDGGGYAIVLGKPDWSMCIRPARPRCQRVRAVLRSRGEA